MLTLLSEPIKQHVKVEIDRPAKIRGKWCPTHRHLDNQVKSYLRKLQRRLNWQRRQEGLPQELTDSNGNKTIIPPPTPNLNNNRSSNSSSSLNSPER